MSATADHPEATSVVPQSSLEQVPGWMRTPLGPRLAWTSLYFVLPAVVVLAVVLPIGLTEGKFSPIGAVAAAAAIGLLALGFTWVFGAGLTPVGVAIQESGVVVFERTLSSKRANRRMVAWGEFHDAVVSGRGVILQATQQAGVYLTHGQAKAVLLDPRSPLRERLRPKVVRRLGN